MNALTFGCRRILIQEMEREIILKTRVESQTLVAILCSNLTDLTKTRWWTQLKRNFYNTFYGNNFLTQLCNFSDLCMI